MKLHEQIASLRESFPTFDPVDIVVYLSRHLPDLEEALAESGIDMRSVITGMAVVLVPLHVSGEIPDDLSDVLPTPGSPNHQANALEMKRMNRQALSDIREKIEAMSKNFMDDEEETELPPEIQAFLDKVTGGSDGL